ncbi:MAG: ABC transporter ATP-binding protein, partial [Bacteroidia bacterium]
YSRTWQKRRGKVMGMVFQEPMTALNPQLRCGDQLMEAYSIHEPHTPKDEARRHCLAKLERAGLGSLAERVMDSFPHELSGGQRQRVVIAMACMHNPAWVLADEPTTALDSFTRMAVMSDLKRLCQEQGSGLIWVSHELDIVAEMAQEISVLRKGQCLAAGPAAEVLNPNSCHPYVAELIEALPKGSASNVASDRPVLDIRQLFKSYMRNGQAQSVLNGFSATVHRGETLVILGKSGSGKSTLAKLLTGLERPDSGEIWLSGKPLPLRPPTGIQMVFQDPYASLNQQQESWYAVAEVLAQQQGGRPADHRSLAESKLREVQLPESLFSVRPRRMSGGQRQRLCLARALASEPEVLVLDEAVAALDPLVQAAVLDLLKHIQQTRGTVFIFITHDQAVARSIGNQIVYLENGHAQPYV